MSSKLESKWDGDELDRTSIGRFLYKYLIEKYKTGKDKQEFGAISFALDGGWGSGKTFFVRHWCKEIESNGHPVVFFDAWKNDLSEEPLLGFISELKQQIEPLEEGLPAGDKLSKSIGAIASQAGRALIPAAALIGKGLLKKTFGVGLDEILEEVNGEDFKTGSDASATDGAFDRLFDASMTEHKKQMQLVNELKTSLTQMLTELEKKAKVTLPLFVFVDELDRCRPPYAIKLLEGIKHVFDAKNVCFCFSINTDQLCESIKAVYGGGFDSHLYLKRFFDFDYSLPEPDAFNSGYCKLICSSSSLIEGKTFVTGMHDWEKYQSQNNNRDTNIEAASQVIAYVSRAFRLDLRSQRQVLSITEAAASGLAKDEYVHLFYLFSLACIYFLDRKTFSKIQARKLIDTDVKRLIDPAVKQDFVQFDNEGHRSHRSIDLFEVIKSYFDLSEEDLKTLLNRRSTGKYPGNLADTMTRKLQSGYLPRQEYPSPLLTYPRLIAMAGYLSQ